MASNVDPTVSKGTVRTTIDSEPDSPSIENAFQRPERNPVHATTAILVGVLLPCIPIIAVSAALLGIIFSHRIDLNPGHPELALAKNDVGGNITNWITLVRKQGGNAAYYVEYNPSTITTIASWTSRILPWCASSIMALVAFYAARHIVLKSHKSDGSDLPNPQQLTILINVLGGSSWGPIKDTVVHRYRTKERLVSPLPVAVLALFAITLLGIIIPILDSWFGVATTAPIVTQTYPRVAQSSFGRQLSSQTCSTGARISNGCLRLSYQDTFWPCNILNYNCRPVATLYGIGEAPKIAQGVSLQNKVWNYTDSSKVDYHYLGNPNQDALVDFMAQTIATSTTCVPMTRKCYKYDPNLTTDANYALIGTYNCTNVFHGSLFSNTLQDSTTYRSPNVGVGFSQNPELTVAGELVRGPDEDEQDSRLPFSFAKIYPTNPLYFGAWAIGYPQGDPSNGLINPFGNDEGVFWTTTIDDDGGATWQLNCSTTVYDVSYTWINGAVHEFNTTKSTADLAGLLSAPFAYASNLSAIPLALSSAAQIASTFNTSVGLANAFATEMSKNMLAYGVGAMEPQLNLLEQGRKSTLRVARVPVVPLYLLLATKAVYVVVVLILATWAFCFSHPSETEAVRMALSTKGLAAAHFESPGLLQANVVKEVRSRLEAAKSGPLPPEKAANDDKLFSPRRLQHSATAPVQRTTLFQSNSPGQNTTPVQNTTPTEEVKVGLLPAADGTWQFVMIANGVWNSIKPIVKSIVVADANTGGLGDVGKVISAWK